MLVDYHHIIMQVLVVLLLWLLLRLLGRFISRARRKRIGCYTWTLAFWVMSLINLGVYWIAYPVALWMILALGLIFLQLIHNHEFIYRRYWPVFWPLSMCYAGLVFVVSLFSGWLPLI